MSIATAVKPVTFTSMPYSSSQPVVLRAQLAHELGGGRVVGRGLGHDLHDAGVGGLVRGASATSLGSSAPFCGNSQLPRSSFLPMQVGWLTVP